MEILNPTVKFAVDKGTLAPRVETLDDKVVGFIWNGYAGGDRLLRRVDEILSSKYEIRGKKWHQKDYIGEPCKREVQDEFVASCDVIITSIGA